MITYSPALRTLLCLLAFADCRDAIAGYVVLMADNTPTFPLIYDSPEPFEGNRRFFRNLLGGGDTVLALGSSGMNQNLVEFYREIEGVSTLRASRELTSSFLEGVDLITIASVIHKFSVAETRLLDGYLKSGGNLFISFEWPYGQDVHLIRDSMHSLLKSLNVDMRVDLPYFDIGRHVATGGQILEHVLTADVESFQYGSGAKVNGGTPLFLSQNGHSFAAAVLVPEPATPALSGLGMLALAALRRRK